MRTIWTIVISTAVAIGYVLCYWLQAIIGASARPDSAFLAKDWATLALACAAFLVSSGALYFNWIRAKQEAFLDIHDKLIELGVQEGRRLLYTKIKGPNDPARLSEESPEEFDKINRALAMFDVLGLYVRRRYVFRSWVMNEWGANLAGAWPQAQHFIAHREKQVGREAWPNYKRLSLEAVIKNQKPFTSDRAKALSTCDRCGAVHF
ncbi:hypothetical protein ACIQTW_13140 [Paenarthrobacter sp. NPDC090517]|uniref:hypothetical protein n=1 Tax=Paenarthrobacter sp. NPDC090517 TaxID=3364381 RepID=UPI00381E85C2